MRFQSLLPVLFAALVYAKNDLTVQTAQGTVVGTSPVKGVNQYLGIPYATAARWKPPQPPANYTSPLQATNFGAACPQHAGATVKKYLELVGQNEPLVESEDCLFLNIWAPGKNRPKNAGVLIYLHGGAMAFGSGNLKVYNGKHLVQNNDGIIVVTINYRLSIFGQPGSPTLANLDKSQNFGLLDIRAAVEWVHANIAAFGGDPNQITLGGHSAGGLQIEAYTFAYPQDTIVKGLIVQSANSLAPTILDPTVDSTFWTATARAVGCGELATPLQLPCMTQKPWKDLIDGAVGANVPFFFLVQDNKLVFPDMQSRMENSNFLKVPTLIGTVEHESDAFAVAGMLVTRGYVPTVLTHTTSDIDSLGVTCPKSVWTSNLFNANVPTWRYHFQAQFPNQSPRTELRCYHSSELQIVLGTYPDFYTNPTPREKELSKNLQHAWASFVRNPTSGLDQVGNWTRYDPSANTLNLLGNRDNLTGVSSGSPAQYDALCSSRQALSEIATAARALLPPAQT